MLAKWWTRWRRWHERQQRGKLLEQAIHRVGGDLALVDRTLTQLALSSPRPKLSLRSQGRHGKQLGFFLPLWEPDSAPGAPPLPDLYQPSTQEVTNGSPHTRY